MTALLPAGLAFLMLVVGFRLTVADFRLLWRRPAGAVTGLVAQMLALPLLAILISKLLDLPPSMALGLLVVAAAPGGITSNFITLLARGDAALSTTMTLFTSLAATVSIPAVLSLGGAPLSGGLGGLAGAVAKTGLAVMAVSALPLIAGMALRRFATAPVERVAPSLEKAATVIFLGLVAAAFYQNWDAMVSYAPQAGPAAMLLNLAAIATAFVAGKAARLPGRQTLAIAIECGLQNVAMAMFIASNVLLDENLMIPALVYAVVMNVSALALLIGGRLALRSAS